MAAVAVIMCLLMLPDVTTRAALESGKLAIGLVLPSLFPMLVMSSVAVTTGAARRLGPVASAFCIGLLAGFPVGAATVEALYEHGAVSRDTAARMLPWCNNTGPAFIVGVVGLSIWGSPAVGWALYACHAASAAIVGFAAMRRYSSVAVSPPSEQFVLRFPEALTDAVRRAALSSLNIAAFIVFFGVITAVAEHFVGRLSPLQAGFLEMTQGVVRAASSDASFAFRLAAQSWLMGFAGMSVYFQTRSVTTLPTGFYLFGKMAQGLIAAALAYITAPLLEPVAAVVMSPAPVGGRGGLALSALIVILYSFM